MREWLNRLIGWVGMDGLLHILASVILMLVMRFFAPIWLAVVLVTAIGVAKEVVWDLAFNRGELESKDLICDMVGILLGCLAYI